jgi:hypothetical protein
MPPGEQPRCPQSRRSSVGRSAGRPTSVTARRAALSHTRPRAGHRGHRRGTLAAEL